MNNRDIAAAIRNSVSALEVGRALGLNLDRHGRCSCPFHHGESRNLKLYDGNRGFYCFVCHRSGDCISLVQGVVPECSYIDAMWWVNDRFGLGFRKENERPSVLQRDRRGKIQQRKMNNGFQNARRDAKTARHASTGGACEPGQGGD